ncbi:11543_t:CDS:1, partial [Racocetra fulgida]
SPFTEKRLQDNPSPINIDTKQVTRPSSTNKAQGNQKILTLQEFLKDSNLEKIDNQHIYYHYCDTGQPITLHQIDNSYRLWQHLET